MGHPSPAKYRAEVLAATVAEMGAARLELTCGTPGCLGRREVRLADLAWGRENVTVGWLLDRLRCARCRRRPASVVVVQPARVVGQRLELVGCGL